MNIYTNFSLKLHKYVQFSSGGNTPFLTTISDVQFTKREPTSRLLHQPQLTHPQAQIHTETPLQFYPNMHENKPTVPELYETNRKLKVNYNFRGYSRLGQYVMTFILIFMAGFEDPIILLKIVFLIFLRCGTQSPAIHFIFLPILQRSTVFDMNKYICHWLERSKFWNLLFLECNWLIQCDETN